MVNDFKQSIASNRSLLPTSLDVARCSFVKTQNGDGHVLKKVVFLVFSQSSHDPVCVVYCSRSKDGNIAFNRMISSMKEHQPTAPHVYFHGEIEGLSYAFVEFIAGHRPRLDSASDRSIVDQYVSHRSKDTAMSVVNVGQLYDTTVRNIGTLVQIGSREQEMFDRDYRTLSGLSLGGIPQHGDFQENNMIIIGTQLRVIDWDDWGTMDYPLLDYCSINDRFYRQGIISRAELLERIDTIARQYGIVDGKKGSALFRLYQAINFMRKERVRESLLAQQRFDKISWLNP